MQDIVPPPPRRVTSVTVRMDVTFTVEEGFEEGRDYNFTGSFRVLPLSLQLVEEPRVVLVPASDQEEYTAKKDPNVVAIVIDVKSDALAVDTTRFESMGITFKQREQETWFDANEMDYFTTALKFCLPGTPLEKAMCYSCPTPHEYVYQERLDVSTRCPRIAQKLPWGRCKHCQKLHPDFCPKLQSVTWFCQQCSLTLKRRTFHIISAGHKSEGVCSLCYDIPFTSPTDFFALGDIVGYDNAFFQLTDINAKKNRVVVRQLASPSPRKDVFANEKEHLLGTFEDTVWLYPMVPKYEAAAKKYPVDKDGLVIL